MKERRKKENLGVERKETKSFPVKFQGKFTNIKITGD